MFRAELQAELAGELGSAQEARWILEDVLGPPPSPAPPTAAQVAAARALARRRSGGEPLQYVLGHWSFRTLELTVDRRALIPRPETEQVVEVALAELARCCDRPDPLVVDLGTGTGAIALALATEGAERFPGLRVWASDASAEALALARLNRDRVGARHPEVAERVVLRHGDWFDALPAELAGRVDLVISNPPYVAEEEWPGLEAEVRAEPRRALVAAAGSRGTPGLADVEAVVGGAARWLAPNGAVVVEIAPHQAEPARAAAGSAGLRQVTVAPDLSGRPRALVGRR